MNIRGVCFDMDGLLLDTETLGCIIDDQAAALQGLLMDEIIRDKLLGSNFEACQKHLSDHFGDRIDAHQFICDWRRLIREYALQHGVPKKQGADETLRQLKQMGIPMALCTSNGPQIVQTYLARTGWDDIFNTIVDGTMVEHSKPDPQIFRLGAQRLGLDPSECAGVEDSMNGLKAVRGAGMFSVMIPDLKPYSEAYMPYVDICLSSLDELIPTLFCGNK